MTSGGEEQLPAKDVLPALVDHHRRFLAFLKGKVGSEATAEEILQSAFVRGIEASKTVRDDESAVAWFYRLLRNAVVDHYRHEGAQSRALARFAVEMPEDVDDAPEDVTGSVCACVGELLSTLRPEDGALIREVDVEGIAVADAAGERNITSGNARVRLHRARKALRRRVEEACGTCATHGCLECSCKPKSSEKHGL